MKVQKQLASIIAILALGAGCGSRVPQAPAVAPAPPPPAMEPEDSAATAFNGPVPGAERVIATLRPRFKACYEAGRRDENPKMAGQLRMVALVGPDGTVRNAKVEHRDGLSPRVETCITDQMRKTSFPPPGGDGGAVQVPLKFIRSVR